MQNVMQKVGLRDRQKNRNAYSKTNESKHMYEERQKAKKLEHRKTYIKTFNNEITVKLMQ